jgi:hypothetical protein
LEKIPPFPCTKLTGKVVSEGKRIAGATVKILDRKFNPLYHADTDGEGNYSFKNIIMPGDYEMISVADGFSVSESYKISLLPFAPLSVTIHLIPNRKTKLGTIYGIVRDEKNNPLPGVEVSISQSNNVEHNNAVAVTNSDGEYLIYGLRPENYMLSAFLQGYALPDEISVELNPQENACADIYLYRQQSALKGTISGRVTHNGIIVPFATVALYRIENNNGTLIKVQEANSKGIYLFACLEPGEYQVKATFKECMASDSQSFLV